jgi:hypothetical protein
MSESKNESDGSAAGISDDQLPDDLNPDENPLADPEGKGAAAEQNSSGDSGDSGPDSDSGGGEGMPDMGQPG